MLSRRSFFGGLALIAAPAVIRTPGLIMPVKAWAGLPPAAPLERITVRGWMAYDPMIQAMADGGASWAAVLQQAARVLIREHDGDYGQTSRIYL